MVTNINLGGAEEEKKTAFSGQTTLILSFLLLLAAFGVFGAIKFMTSRYLNTKKDLEAQINAEKAKLSSSAYSDLTDFQKRLDVLDQIISSHGFLEPYLKNFSRYILPEVKLGIFSWDGAENRLCFSGVAPNFDVLSRQLILLRSNSSFELIELKNASESQAAEGGGSSIQFEISTKISQDSFNKQ